MLETALGADLDEHLGHERGERSGSGNVRNGSSPKTVRTDVGEVRINGPATGPARSPRRWCQSIHGGLAGFDDAVVSLCAKGLTTGDIAIHLPTSTAPADSRPVVEAEVVDVDDRFGVVVVAGATGTFPVPGCRRGPRSRDGCGRSRPVRSTAHA